MRALSSGLAAHLASGATSLATCWKLTRRDDVVLAFTDHDEAISFSGTTYEPMLDGSEISARLGQQVDTGEIVGVLQADAITEDDIATGLYDGASVETWRVNWRDVAERVRLRRATIGEIVREDGQFRAELRSGQQVMNRVSGRIYSPLCDAVLGDGRCKVSGSHPAFGEGCDRQLTTCRERFDNVPNFRGFPHIPGNDLLLKYPRGEELEGEAVYE